MQVGTTPTEPSRASRYGDRAELRERVIDYLAARTTLNLATHGPAGLWACAVLYVQDGTRLYFTSVASTRHGQNMAATGRVVGTISDECTAWEELRGVQLEGTVARVDELDERRRIVRVYLRRFPFAAALWNGETDFEAIARDPGIHDFYRITPTRLLFTDNAYAPGVREEVPSE